MVTDEYDRWLTVTDGLTEPAPMVKFETGYHLYHQSSVTIAIMQVAAAALIQRKDFVSL